MKPEHGRRDDRTIDPFGTQDVNALRDAINRPVALRVMPLLHPTIHSLSLIHI